MKNTRDRLMDAFLQKISALPIVHKMVEEQTALDESESMAERMHALRELNILRDKEDTAAKALENALSARKAAEAKVKPLHENACLAQNEFNNAYSARQHREQDYLRLHGEGMVHLTLSRLQSYRATVASELAITQTDARAKELEARLATLDKLIPEATALLNAELSPHAIKNRADALIDAAGLKPSAPELATH